MSLEAQIVLRLADKYGMDIDAVCNSAYRERLGDFQPLSCPLQVSPTFPSTSSYPRDTSTSTKTTCQEPLSSIACLHLYAHLNGRYPKLGLFCNVDLEIVSVGPHNEGSEDEISITQEEICCNTSHEEEDATSWVGVKRPPTSIDKQIEGSIPNVAGTNQESTPRKRDIGDFNRSPSIRAVGTEWHQKMQVPWRKRFCG